MITIILGQDAESSKIITIVEDKQSGRNGSTFF